MKIKKTSNNSFIKITNISDDGLFWHGSGTILCDVCYERIIIKIGNHLITERYNCLTDGCRRMMQIDKNIIN